MREKLEKILQHQIVLYGFWGILTSILNIGLFYGLTKAGVDYKAANVITLIVVKIASYIVNKLFVFKSDKKTPGEVFKEFMLFMGSRGFTMIIDFFGVLLFTEVLRFSPNQSKSIFIVIVVIINYFFGKKIFLSD